MTLSMERYQNFNEALQNNTSFASLRACPDESNICYMYTTVGGDGEKFFKRYIKEGLLPRPQLFAEHGRYKLSFWSSYWKTIVMTCVFGETIHTCASKWWFIIVFEFLEALSCLFINSTYFVETKRIMHTGTVILYVQVWVQYLTLLLKPDLQQPTTKPIKWSTCTAHNILM